MKKLVVSIEECEKLTQNCTGLTLNVALNYGLSLRGKI